VKYLQKAFLPVKAAVIKGGSPDVSGVVVVNLSSI